MSKSNISATVDQDVKEYVSNSTVNTSGLVNKLLRQHMNCGTTDERMLEFRIQQVESELDDLQGRVERKREELEELKERKSEMRQQSEEVFEKAAEALSPDDLREENRKVVFWAGEADMPVSEFVEKMEGRVE